MMLSDRDIREALRRGELSIHPFTDSQIRPAAITFHLGEELLLPRRQEVVDLNDPTTAPEYDSVRISDTTPHLLAPGSFLLGHTAEHVTIGNSLGLLIEGRSTLARLGISVVQTAMIVDTGHTDRPITLEIANLGPSAVTLYGGMAVARGAVWRLSSDASRAYDTFGRYADQSEGVGEARPQVSSDS